MTSAMEKYDPTKLMEAVRDRIRAEFVALIPDAVWTDMVQKEINEFFRMRDSRVQLTSSMFGDVVRAELKTECVKRILAYFGTDEWQAQWNSEGKPIVSPAMEQMIVRLMPDVLKAVFGDIAQEIVQNAMTRLRGSF